MMKFIFKYVLVIFVFSVCSLDMIQAQYSNDNHKIYFDNFEILTNGNFLITQESGEVLAQIYNAKEKRVVFDLVRSGKGPFELENMGGVAFNRQTENIYVIDLKNGRIICFDDIGRPLREKSLKFHHPYIRKIDAFREDLILTPGIFIIDKISKKYPIAYLLDPDKLEISDTLFFDLNRLKLNKIKDFDKVKYFEIKPLVISSFSKDLYLVAFEDFNKIFLINRESELMDEIEIEVNNVETPIVVKHPSFGYGIKTFALFNDYMRMGEAVYLSFTEDSRASKNGLVEVRINSKGELITHTHLLDTELGSFDPFIPFVVVSDGSEVFGADGIDIIPFSFN